MAQIPNPNYTSTSTDMILKKLLEEQDRKRAHRMLVKAPGAVRGPRPGPPPTIGMTPIKPGYGQPTIGMTPIKPGPSLAKANPVDLQVLRRLTTPKGMGRAGGVGTGAALVALLTLLEEGYNWYNQEDAGAHSADEALKEITMELTSDAQTKPQVTDEMFKSLKDYLMNPNEFYSK